MIDALSIVFRSLSFIAIFQAAGMAVFHVLFRRQLSDSSAASLIRLARLSTTAGLVLVAAHFTVEPARMSGSLEGFQDRSLWEFVLGTSSTSAMIWRSVGLAILLVGLGARSALGRLIAILGVTMVLVSFTQTGHTTVFSPRPLLALLLLIHLAIVAFWFGALLPLGIVAAKESAQSAARIVERFSRIAVWWVPGLLVAGLGLAALLVGSWEAVTTPYARLLFVKLALFGFLMLLAGLNRWRYGPALARGAAAGRKSFARTLTTEFLLIASALSATAALTTLYSPES